MEHLRRQVSGCGVSSHSGEADRNAAVLALSAWPRPVAARLAGGSGVSVTNVPSDTPPRRQAVLLRELRQQ